MTALLLSGASCTAWHGTALFQRGCEFHWDEPSRTNHKRGDITAIIR